MSVFLISYDAHRVRDYRDLYDAMNKIDAVRILESLWAVNVNNTETEVRSWVRDLLDDDDSIFVLKLKPPHAWAGRYLKESASDWLKANA